MGTPIQGRFSDGASVDSSQRRRGPKAWLTPRNWFVSLALASLLIVTASVLVAKSYLSHTKLVFDEPVRLDKCRIRIAGLYDPKVLDLNLVGQIHALCYAEVNEEDRLVEFEINRSALLNQQAETPVLLWMVVAITMSGVFLAAVQLMAGYKLASAGKGNLEQGGELGLENNRLSLKSSVTGLIILTISLAFFYIFVSQVYLLKPFDLAPPPSVGGLFGVKTVKTTPITEPAASTSSPTDASKEKLGLQPGGLGPPPSNPATTNTTPAVK